MYEMCATFCFASKDAHNHPSCAGLDVASFMLTPVQRVPRYVLLLKVVILNRGVYFNLNMFLVFYVGVRVHFNAGTSTVVAA